MRKMFQCHNPSVYNGANRTDDDPLGRKLNLDCLYVESDVSSGLEPHPEVFDLYIERCFASELPTIATFLDGPDVSSLRPDIHSRGISSGSTEYTSHYETTSGGTLSNGTFGSPPSQQFPNIPTQYPGVIEETYENPDTTSVVQVANQSKEFTPAHMITYDTLASITFPPISQSIDYAVRHESCLDYDRNNQGYIPPCSFPHDAPCKSNFSFTPNTAMPVEVMVPATYAFQSSAAPGLEKSRINVITTKKRKHEYPCSMCSYSKLVLLFRTDHCTDLDPLVADRFFNLKTHLKTHDPMRERFYCELQFCGKSYTRKSDLKRHVEEKHPNDKGSSTGTSIGIARGRTRCDHCGASGSGGGKPRDCHCGDVD